MTLAAGAGPRLVLEEATDATVAATWASPAAARTGSAALIACAGSTIHVLPVGGHLLLDGCEDCTVYAAARHITVRNCSRVTLAAWTPNPPLLVGDNRQVTLAANTAVYPPGVLLPALTSSGLLTEAATGAAYGAKTAVTGSGKAGGDGKDSSEDEGQDGSRVGEAQRAALAEGSLIAGCRVVLEGARASGSGGVTSASGPMPPPNAVTQAVAFLPGTSASAPPVQLGSGSFSSTVEGVASLSEPSSLTLVPCTALVQASAGAAALALGPELQARLLAAPSAGESPAWASLPLPAALGAELVRRAGAAAALGAAVAGEGDLTPEAATALQTALQAAFTVSVLLGCVCALLVSLSTPLPRMLSPLLSFHSLLPPLFLQAWQGADPARAQRLASVAAPAPRGGAQ